MGEMREVYPRLQQALQLCLTPGGAAAFAEVFGRVTVQQLRVKPLLLAWPFPCPKGKHVQNVGNAHEHRANTEKNPKPATSIVRVTCVLPGALWDDILLIPGKQISITLANF